MPKISGPFHSLFYPDYNGDRVYSDEDFGLPFRLDHSNGVYLNQSTQALQITAAGDMNLTIRAGYCFIEGHFGGTPMDGSMTLDNADGIYPRIDRIVMRHYGAGGELDERKLAPLVLTGTPAQNPKAPDIVRNGAYYDLSLATVLVPAGAIEITAANITDTRFDTSVCGAVTGNNENPLDTTELFAQFTALFEEMTDGQKAEFAELVKSWTDQTAANQAEFDAFMGQLHDVMGENVATNLLNLVNALRTDVDGHTGELSQHGESLDQHNTRISTLESEFPTVSKTGAIQWFAGNPPSGWILCDGRALSTSTYSKLYTAIGRKYTGTYYNGSTFCVPNLTEEKRIPASIYQMGLLGYLPTSVSQDYSSAAIYSGNGIGIGDAFLTGVSTPEIAAGNLTYDGKTFMKKAIFYWDGSLKQASNLSNSARNLLYSRKLHLAFLCPDLNSTKFFIGGTPEEVLINPAESNWFSAAVSFPIPSGASGYKFVAFALGPQTGKIYALCQTATASGAAAYFVSYTVTGFSWTVLGGVYCESPYSPAVSSPSYFVVSEYTNSSSEEVCAAYVLLQNWDSSFGAVSVLILNNSGKKTIENVTLSGASGHSLSSFSDAGLGVFGNSPYVAVYATHRSSSTVTSSVTRIGSGHSSIYRAVISGTTGSVETQMIYRPAPVSPDGGFWFGARYMQVGRLSSTGSLFWYPLESNIYMRNVCKSYYYHKAILQMFVLNGRVMALAKNYRGEGGIWSSYETLLPFINAN